MNRAIEALMGALWECGRHTHHLTLALRALTELTPLDANRLEHLTDDEVKNIDQLIFRYTSLHDALGQKTFKYLLEATGEPLLSNATFIDRLNVLKRLGLLDAAEWANAALSGTAWYTNTRTRKSAERSFRPQSIRRQC